MPHNATRAGGSGACRIVAVLATDPQAHSKYGAPSSGWLEMIISSKSVEATFQFRGKQTTRLAESMVVSFKPATVPEHHW